MSEELVKSKGHIAFIGPFEYFTIETGDVYRAPIENPLDIYGFRQGARFECTAVTKDMCLKLARQAFAPEPEKSPGAETELSHETAANIRELFGNGTLVYQQTPADLVHGFERLRQFEPSITVGFWLGTLIDTEYANFPEPSAKAAQDFIEPIRVRLRPYFEVTNELVVEGERANRRRPV